MPTISEVYTAFSHLKIREQIPLLVKKTEYPLILKVIGQHKQGISGTGQKITPSYVGKTYSAYKASLNSAPGYGTPDIEVTGAYNSELHLTVKGDEYEIDSDVSYAQSASLTQYGNSLNLPDETSRGEYWNETLAPEILEYISETTGI